MGQNHYNVWSLEGDPLTYVYTTSKEGSGAVELLKILNFKWQFSVYTYGFSRMKGHIYPARVYFDMNDTFQVNRMMRLVRINNGTDEKLREIYGEVCSAQTVARKRWWQYYSK